MPRGIPNNRPDSSTDAANNPVSITQTFEPLEHQIGQDVPRVMKSSGPARDALEPAYIQPVGRPVDKEKLEMLAFMEMPVTVQIHTTADPNAEQVFEVINGGKREFFRRGEVKTVPRKFVDLLATRKTTTFTQKRVRNVDGELQDVQVPQTALRYPFSVIKDPHPRGGDWLAHVLAQA